MKTAAGVMALAALVLVLPTGATMFATPQAVTPLAVGSTIPKDVVLRGIDGKDHVLGDCRGKVVFVHFWSIVCPAEKHAEPVFIELQKAYGDKGVVQFAINGNQREIAGGPPYASLREHAQRAGVNFVITVDPGNKLTDLFAARSTPHCFVIDREGVLRYSGALDDDPTGAKGPKARQYVREAIEALLAGGPVPVSTTKPYG